MASAVRRAGATGPRGPLGAGAYVGGASPGQPMDGAYAAPAPPSRPSVPVGQVRRTRGCGAGWEVSARSAGEALAAAAASVCPYGASGGAAGPGVAGIGGSSGRRARPDHAGGPACTRVRKRWFRGWGLGVAQARLETAPRRVESPRRALDGGRCPSPRCGQGASQLRECSCHSAARFLSP